MDNISDCQHSITIENLKNNETISYSLVIIKGFVETSFRLPICSNNTISISLNNVIYKIQMQQNQFKTTLPINQGENQTVFKFCNTVKLFNINFKPRTTIYKIVPLYIIPNGSNGKFQSANNNNTPEIACDKIYTASRMIQSFFAEKMNDRNLGRKTFQLESDLDLDFPKCYLFHSQIKVNEIKKMKQEELWMKLAKEIMTSSIADSKRKYLAFLSSTHYNGNKYNLLKRKTHDEIVGITDGYVALGGGGLALFGSACLYCWPSRVEDIEKSFLNQDKIDPTKLMDDSCYRGTFGACFATTLGSVCHELGHTFDLGHSDHGLMGRGFDNINRVFVLVPPKIRETLRKNDKLIVTESGSVQDKIIRNDLTVIARNCATILNYHKWFNGIEDKNAVISFDKNTRKISSTYGIQIVEIRTSDSELLVEWWEFSKNSLVKNFVIPAEYFIKTHNHVIFVEDCYGNILKTVAHS